MIKINTTIKGLTQDFWIKITNIKTNLSRNSIATYGYFPTEDTEALPQNAIELRNIDFNYTDSVDLEEQIEKNIEAELTGITYERMPSKVEQLESQLSEIQETVDMMILSHLEGVE